MDASRKFARIKNIQNALRRRHWRCDIRHWQGNTRSARTVEQEKRIDEEIASSTGLLLKKLGLRVTAIKIDPYMNIDPGTISPLEHGQSVGRRGSHAEIV